MNPILLILPLFFTLINPSEEIKTENQEDPVTTYYLIRHAEKDRSDSSNRDPQLTEAGMKRAQNWANILKHVDFDAVYSTNYKRTQQTAQPLADKNQLEVLSYDANKLFSEDFQKATRGKTVMVVGHSNTTPQFANAILGEKKYDDLDDSENGGLFIVHVYPNGTKSSQVLYFNNY